MSTFSDSDNLVVQLNEHFEKHIKGEKPKLNENEIAMSKCLFSRNIVFLRAYLGLVARGAPYDQIEFSDMLSISVPGLRRWETGQVLPNKLSIQAVCQLANQTLKTPIPIKDAHLLYRSLVNEITLLRMGTHDDFFQALPPEQQRRFASFVNSNMDRVLEYFMSEAHEAKINYQVLLENALVGIYVMNHEGKIIYINSPLIHMSGYSPQELIKVGFEAIVHPDDLEDSKKRVKERLSGKIPKEQYNLRIHHKNGRQRTFDVFSSRVILAGKPAILGVLQDITERLENEKLVKESEERYHSLFTSMFTAFALHEVITNKNGKPVDYRFLDVNPAFEKMTGLKSKEIIGKTVMDVLPNTEPYWIERFGNVALTGKPDHITEYSQEFDMYFEVHGYSPKKNQFAVTFIDVTEKIKSQREANRLKFMVDNTTSMILLSRFGSRDLLYVNDAICKELGYTQKELLTMKIDDIDHTYIGMRDKVLEELKSQGKSDFESELIRKDQSVLPVHISVSMNKYETEQLIFANIERSESF